MSVGHFAFYLSHVANDLLQAYESLTAARIFIPVAGSSAMSKEFVKHRCSVDRDVVKRMVDKSGQVNLRKWLNKAQQL